MTSAVSDPSEIIAGLGGDDSARFVNDINSGLLTHKRTSRTLQYWKKCEGCNRHVQERGYITTGPAQGPYTSIEFYNFQQVKHATPLDLNLSYGVGQNIPSFVELSVPATRFNPLIRNGGLHHIPVQQMIDYGWHRRPIMVKNVPVLASVIDIPCEYGCATEGRDARIFTDIIAYQGHISVAHKDIQGPKAIGDIIAKARALEPTATGSMNPSDLAAVIKAVVESLREGK